MDHAHNDRDNVHEYKQLVLLYMLYFPSFLSTQTSAVIHTVAVVVRAITLQLLLKGQPKRTEGSMAKLTDNQQHRFTKHNNAYNDSFRATKRYLVTAITAAIVSASFSTQADEKGTLIPSSIDERATQLSITNDGPNPSQAGVGFIVQAQLVTANDRRASGNITVSGGGASCNIQLPRNYCTLNPTISGEDIEITAIYEGSDNHDGSEAVPVLHSIASNTFPNRVSVGDGGNFDGATAFPGVTTLGNVTPDGRFTSFIGVRANVNDGLGQRSLLLYDHNNRQVTNVSKQFQQDNITHNTRESVISDDGRYAVTTMAVNNNRQVLLFDRETESVVNISAGIQRIGGSDFNKVRISGNGEFASFRHGRPNGARPEFTHDTIYFYNINEGTRTQLTAPANNDSLHSIQDYRLSRDGNMAVVSEQLFSNRQPNENRIRTYDIRNNAFIETVLSYPSTVINQDIAQLALSGDNNIIYFTTFFDGIVPNDTNRARDIFRYNLFTDTLDLVSTNVSGEQLNASSQNISTNELGNVVSFSSLATNLVDSPPDGIRFTTYAKDVQANQIARLHLNQDFEPVQGNSAQVRSDNITTLSVFQSDANITGQRANTALYTIDFGTFTVDNINPRFFGQQANRASVSPMILEDNTRIAFHSEASTLNTEHRSATSEIFIRDLEQNNTALPISDQSIAVTSFDISNNGRYIATMRRSVEDDTSIHTAQLFDQQSGELITLSDNNLGTQAERGRLISVSNDGEFTTWENSDSDLVASDDNNALDIYLYQRSTQSTELISMDENQALGSNDNTGPLRSGNGQYLIFSTNNALSTLDSNGLRDAYRYHTTNGFIERISLSSDGQEPNGNSEALDISDDGNVILFTSTDGNLDLENTGTTEQSLYLRNVANNTTRRVNVPVNGFIANNTCLSADGGFTLASDGANIHFVNNLTGVLSTQNLNANAGLSQRCISQDNHLIAFDSSGNNLVSGDTNDQADVFITLNPQANAAPIATNDQYTLLEDEVLAIPASSATSVLSNDFDPDQDTLVVINSVENAPLLNLGGRYTLTGSGALLLQAGADQFGSDSVNYTITDSIQNSSATISINVLPVNDQPSATLSTTQLEVLSNSGPVTIEGFAQFNPGATNESDQSPTYRIEDMVNFDALSNFNLSTDGTLSFEFNTQVEDVEVSFDLIVSDDGGTDNGGVDTSAAQQVTITLLQDAIFSSGFEAGQ